MTTRIIVEIPRIANQTKTLYPPKSKAENLASIAKAKVNNLHETSKTQCREFRNKVQGGAS